MDAASAQPALGCDAGLIVSTPGVAWISTSSASPATSNSGLGSRISLEFPILMSLDRTTTTTCQRNQVVARAGGAVHATALEYDPAHLPQAVREVMSP